MQACGPVGASIDGRSKCCIESEKLTSHQRAHIGVWASAASRARSARCRRYDDDSRRRVQLSIGLSDPRSLQRPAKWIDRHVSIGKLAPHCAADIRKHFAEWIYGAAVSGECFLIREAVETIAIEHAEQDA